MGVGQASGARSLLAPPAATAGRARPAPGLTAASTPSPAPSNPGQIPVKPKTARRPHPRDEEVKQHPAGPRVHRRGVVRRRAPAPAAAAAAAQSGVGLVVVRGGGGGAARADEELWWHVVGAGVLGAVWGRSWGGFGGRSRVVAVVGRLWRRAASRALLSGSVPAQPTAGGRRSKRRRRGAGLPRRPAPGNADRGRVPRAGSLPLAHVPARAVRGGGGGVGEPASSVGGRRGRAAPACGLKSNPLRGRRG